MNNSTADFAQNLNSVFEQQRSYSWQLRSKNEATSLEQRLELLQKLRTTLLAKEALFCAAFQSDFNKGRNEVLLTEFYPIISEIDLFCRQLSTWLTPKIVSAGVFFAGTKGSIKLVPKGTVLIISPWNYPLNLALVPLVGALAAGNTVILKPSELTPRVSALIQEVLRECFPQQLAFVALGDKSVAQHLLSLPFAHIFFTGSTAVGREVALAAAKSLTPITLELGGKSPVIIDTSANLMQAAQKIIWGKLLNRGQTCVAPDYLFIPKTLLRSFIDECKRQSSTLTTSDLTWIISEQHGQRLQSLLDELRSKHAPCVIHQLTADAAENSLRSPPLRFVEFEKIDLDLRIFTEEIFGPILPIVPYDNIEEVLMHIRSQPRPLALYLFSTDSNWTEFVQRQIVAGAVSINEVILHFGQHNLPAGGTGASGQGNYHGHASLVTFSHATAQLERRWGDFLLRLIYPPYQAARANIIKFALHYLRGI